MNNVLNLSVAHIKLSCCLNSDYSAQAVWATNIVLLVLFLSMSKHLFFQIYHNPDIIKILRQILDLCMCTNMLFIWILYPKNVLYPYFTLKICHHLLTLTLFQTFISFFLLEHKRIYFEKRLNGFCLYSESE